MKKRRLSSSSTLTHEDRHLWKRVAETVTPLSRSKAAKHREEMAQWLEPETAGSVSQSAKPPTIPRQPKAKAYHPPKPPSHLVQPPAASVPHSPVSHPIEERILRKLAKGRQQIDSRIDLHGMTQDRARAALLDFLQMAQASGHRIVLVITGKGNEGRGVLRRNVPLWLDMPPHSHLINGYRISHVSHGGEGALYVRLRKPAAQRDAATRGST